MLSVYKTCSSAKEIKLHSESLISNAQVNVQPKEKVSSLSGGMLQRLIIERELFQNGNLIIISHPLQALDFSAQNELCSKLFSLKQNGKAILIIGGDDFPLSLCDRVYSLENGKSFLQYESQEVKQ